MIDRNMIEQFIRAIPLYFVSAFQWITQALPTFILWCTALYGVLQLVYMGRKVFAWGKHEKETAGT